MYKRITYFSLLFLSTLFLAAQNLIIQTPKESQIDMIIQMDKEISLEFFLPLYQYYFAKLEIPKKPEDALLEELAEDKKLLQSLTSTTSSNTHALIAWDEENQQCAGLIIVTYYHEDESALDTQNNSVISIDLLLVDKKYRHKKIGQQLIETARVCFPHCSQMIVTPFKENNEATLTFYQQCGFKEEGKPKGKNSWGIEKDTIYYRYLWRKPSNNIHNSFSK